MIKHHPRSLLRFCLCGTVLLGMLLVDLDARAIPLFARKYGTTCFTCHTSEPLLNDFGRRFQAAGFQLPGASTDPTAQTDQGAFPLALVAHPAITMTTVRNQLSDSSAVVRTVFSGIELALFSSASLGPHFSYFAEVPVAISGNEVSIDVRSAAVLYTDVLGDGLGNLNFKIGKLMPLLAYPANVLLSNVDPLAATYSPYPQIDSPLNTLLQVDPFFGAAAFGMLPQVLDGLRWEVGFYGGNASDIDLSKGRAVVASLNQTVYLDNAPLRVGVSYLGGMQHVLRVRSRNGGWDNTTDRIGVDLDLTDPWTKRVELSMQYIRGFDSDVDSSNVGLHSDLIMAGVQVILLPERLYAFARLDYLEAQPVGDIHRQYDVGLRYHVQPNVVLTAGYSLLHEHQVGVNDRLTTTASLGVLFGF